MALKETYEVCRLDSSGYKIFHSKTKAEQYGQTLKRTEEEKIQITRTLKGGVPYVYYI
jgi:hypothetical protein